MKFSNSPISFVENMKRGPTYSRIDIPAIPEYFDSLTTHLKAQGHSASEITDLIWENLRAICPICCCWTKAEILSGISLISDMGRDRVTMTRYGMMSRLLDGLCVNQDCSSREILLVWKGPEEIGMQIQGHLDRIKLDSEEKGHSGKIKCVEKLNHPDILAFTKDTIFALRLNCTDHHLYIKRRFPLYTKSHNLCVWISAIPYLGKMAKYVFPQGYGSFLTQVLAESDYFKGDVVFAHWIYMFHEQEIPLINLTLIPEKNLSEEEKFVMLPAELLTKKEHRDIGLSQTA